MDKIAVLIPCYNEEVTVAKVVTDFKRALPEATVYVYNNNSTDRTVQLAEEAGAVVRNEYMQGKGYVVRRMFRELDAECYIMVDGDDTYPAEAAPAMADLVLHRNADMVIGDRLSTTYFEENKRPFHNLGNTVVRNKINRLFNNNISDIMTGYRAFNYEFVKTFPVLSKGFEIETEMSIHAVDKNLQIDSIPIQYKDRPEGSVSKLSTYSDGMKVLKTIRQLYRIYHPMRYYGKRAVVMALLSTLFFIPVLLEYFKTGLVQRFPTLIVCGFVMLTAIISMFTGSILQALRIADRQEFEMKYTNASRKKHELLKSKNI